MVIVVFLVAAVVTYLIVKKVTDKKSNYPSFLPVSSQQLTDS